MGAFSCIVTGAAHVSTLKVLREEYDNIKEMCFVSMYGGMVSYHMYPSHMLLDIVQRMIGKKEGGWENARVGCELRKYLRKSLVWF